MFNISLRVVGCYWRERVKSYHWLLRVRDLVTVCNQTKTGLILVTYP